MRGPEPSTVREDGQPRDPVADVLLVVGDGAVSTYRLDGGALVIGRGDACDVVIDDRSLSRRHAIVRPGPPATVQDLASTNGTQVAGVVHRGGAPIAFAAGDGFTIGRFAFLIVRHGRRRDVTGSTNDVLTVADPTAGGVTPVVRDIARSGASVLILGETGVGKELLAETLHALSGRAGLLTRINCAALSESLLESELFGHERGAFTGAAVQKPGLLETADRGTVFLDEIGEMPLPSQAKLLRVVEQREVLRLGATRPIPLDVRFVAATNRDLTAEVEAGAFRRDLFFRLDGVELVIPPLRERRQMIGGLALGFVAHACARGARPTLRLEPAALAALEAHPWPGNVRELKAVLERAVLLARGAAIGPRQLAFAFARAPRGAAAPPDAPEVRTPPEPAAPDARALEELSVAERADRDRLLRALEQCAGNQSRAARQLGISRTTMVTKLGRYRIKRPRG
jgi:two-component system, NtrC family, response regulator AtoC